MDKKAGTMIREFEEERKKKNTRLCEMLWKQNLMQERIRTGVIGLTKKVGGTIYPCEYNDALVDVVRLIDKLEWEKSCDDCEYLDGDCCRLIYEEKENK